MYNQEIKERFLEEVTASGARNEKSCAAILEAISSYEQVIGKDFARMSKDEATLALCNTHAVTYGSAFAVVSMVRRYVKWCHENCIFDGVNESLQSISVEDIDASEDLKNLIFRNEDEFITSLRSVRPFDDGYYDVVVLVFAWLGIIQDSAAQLKIDDVNLEEMIINLENGNRIPISERLNEILRIYSKTKTGSRMARQGLREVYRDDSFDRFVRKFCAPKQLGKALTKAQIQSAVHDLNEIYVEQGNPPRFTNSNVLASGALRRVYEVELSGIDVFSIKNKKIVLDAYRVDAKLHEVLWLYKNYKKAFSL